MKKYQIGNIIKTKEGDKCIIVDIKDKEIIAFNLCEMEPQKLKFSDIKERVGDANCTTVVVNGKKTVRKQDEDEAKEIETETIEVDTESDENDSETESDPAEIFGELVKLFGKAAIELGNILTNVVERDENDNKR